MRLPRAFVRAATLAAGLTARQQNQYEQQVRKQLDTIVADGGASPRRYRVDVFRR
jgi:hypothetical protein